MRRPRTAGRRGVGTAGDRWGPVGMGRMGGWVDGEEISTSNTPPENMELTVDTLILYDTVRYCIIMRHRELI